MCSIYPPKEHVLLRGLGGKFLLPRRRRSIPRSRGWEMSIFFPVWPLEGYVLLWGLEGELSIFFPVLPP